MIKDIRGFIKDVGLPISVRYMTENRKGQRDYTPMYELTFPSTPETDYYDSPRECIEAWDAIEQIKEYMAIINSRNAQKESVCIV